MNKTLICLPMKEKGVTIARAIKKMGMHSSDTAQVFLDDVRVPQKYAIGSEVRRGGWVRWARRGVGQHTKRAHPRRL